MEWLCNFLAKSWPQCCQEYWWHFLPNPVTGSGTFWPKETQKLHLRSTRRGKTQHCAPISALYVWQVRGMSDSLEFQKVSRETNTIMVSPDFLLRAKPCTLCDLPELKKGDIKPDVNCNNPGQSLCTASPSVMNHYKAYCIRYLLPQNLADFCQR